MATRLTLLVCMVVLSVSFVLAQQTIRLEVSPASTTEDSAASFNFVFTRAGSTVAQIVTFAVTGTSSQDDWTQTGATSFNTTDQTGTITIPLNMNTATLNFSPTTDTTPELDETIIVSLADNPAYTRNTTAGVVATIINDDLFNVTVDLAPTSVVENGTANGVFTFKRNNAPTTIPLKVNFAVSGTAKLTSDFTQTGADTFNATHGTLTFPAGQSSHNVTIDPADDTVGEADETLTLTITSGDLYRIGTDNSKTLTITDNDPQAVTVAVSGSPVFENAGSMTFTFTRVGAGTGANVTVSFTVGGSAAFPTDYTHSAFEGTFTATTGTITLVAGSTTASIVITPVGDSNVEPDETVILSIQPGSGYSVGPENSATGVIANDDASVTLSVAPAQVDEDGDANIVYTFTRTGFLIASLDVQFNVSGSAGLNQDYTVSGSLTFASTLGSIRIPANETSAQLIINPTADNLPEQDETVILQIIPGAGYTIGTADAIVSTIKNDDINSITVTVSPTRVLEDSGTSATFTFTRSGNALAPLSVTIQASGSATFNAADTALGDYSVSGASNFNGGTGTVVISAGTTQQNVLVTPIADQVEESDETVTFTVVAGSGYEVGSPASGTVTIANDDGNQNVVSITSSPEAVNEDAGIPIIFTISRTGSISSPLTVPFAASGNALFGSDYSLAGATFFNGQSGVATINANSIQTVLTVTPQRDTIVEENELLSIAILPPTDNTYTVNPNQFQATSSILNDDVQVFTPDNQLDNSFTIIGFVFPARKKRAVPANNVIELVVANCLRIPRDRVSVLDVVGNFVRVRILSEINGRSSATLAREMILRVNSRDLCIVGTALDGVQALFIPQTIEEAEEPEQDFSLQLPSVFPSPAPPPPSPAPSPKAPPPSSASQLATSTLAFVLLLVTLFLV